MKKTAFIIDLKLLYLLIILASYSHLVSAQSSDLTIADTIKTVKTPQHILIPHTQLFFIKPQGFEYNEARDRYEKDERNHINILVNAGRPVQGEINMLKIMMKQRKLQPGVIYEEKEFLINDQPSLLIHTYSHSINYEYLNLTIGSASNTYNIIANFTGGQKNRDEMLSALLSIFFDESIKPTPQFKYTLDLSKSAFKLNTIEGSMHVYTLGGKGNYKIELINQIIIQALPPMPSLATLVKHNDLMMNRFKQRMSISQLQENDVTMNGLKGWESTYESLEGNISSKNYQLIIGNEVVSILLKGTAYTDKEATYQQIKDLIKTLQLKK